MLSSRAAQLRIFVLI
jgi:hypothetical protein